jgi:DNA invertase Pin-like site-specific DNA recombinase
MIAPFFWKMGKNLCFCPSAVILIRAKEIKALFWRKWNGFLPRRLQREKLLDLARGREIDSIIVWKLDRWERSVADLVTSLNELREVGVGFVSITEALVLTTSSRRAMAGLLAVFAELERDLIWEKVRAGLDQARKKGKVLGRPQTAMSKAAEVLSLRRKSLLISEIARRTHIDRRSVRRIIERSANGALTP